MLILEIAAGVFLGGMGLWAFGLLRDKKQTRDTEGEVEVLQEKTDQISSELKNIKSQFAETQEALENSHPIADEMDHWEMANLGRRYYQGDGVLQDYGEAMKWCRLAATQGSTFAQNMLGHMYQKGEGVEPDFQEALRWYRLTAEQGDPLGQSMLGQMYEKGEGVEQNYQEAVKWLRLAAAQGNDLAMLHLGRMYLYGEGVAQDSIRARMWFLLALAKGNKAGQDIILMTDDLMSPEEIKKAEDLAQSCMNNNYQDCSTEAVPDNNDSKITAHEHQEIQEIAERSVVNAIAVVGLRYLQGQDYANAAVCLGDAAEQGLAEAQYSLGWMYYYGQYFAQDYAMTVKWWHKAAEQNYGDAQYNLGIMYSQGLGVSQDYVQAAEWLGKAAEQGFPNAQYNLGLMYLRGQGVAQDNEQAHHWISLAAASGDNLAIEALDLLARQ